MLFRSWWSFHVIQSSSNSKKIRISIDSIRSKTCDSSNAYQNSLVEPFFVFLDLDRTQDVSIGLHIPAQDTHVSHAHAKRSSTRVSISFTLTFLWLLECAFSFSSNKNPEFFDEKSRWYKIRERKRTYSNENDIDQLKYITTSFFHMTKIKLLHWYCMFLIFLEK